jgi:hypothetical protein
MAMGLISCGSAPVKSEKIGNQIFHNFSARLNLFWEKAHDKTLDQQIVLWDKYVEGKYSEIYNNLLWKRHKGPYPQIYKKLYLFGTFEMYKANEKIIFQNDLNFINFTKARIKHFQKFYPDAQFNSDVIVMPVGLSEIFALASIYNHPQEERYKTMILLNSDLLSLTPAVINKTITHELFHAYHFEQIGLEKAEKMIHPERMNLAKMLFIEGIAVYGTKRISQGPKPNLSIRGMDNLLEKMLVVAKTEYAKIGVNLEIDKVHIDPEKITPFSHCGQVLKKSEQARFSCEDIYEMGGKFVKSLSKLYTFPKILKFDDERIELEVHKFLKGKLDMKAANMLKHL